MVLIKYNRFNNYIALCLGILVFYLIMVKQVFFTFFRQIDSFALIHQNLEMLMFVFIGLAILMFILLFFHKTINKHITFLLLPYLLSVMTWLYTNYIPSIKFYKKLSSYGEFEAIFIVSYIIYGVWLIPLTAYTFSFLFRKLEKKHELQ
ncbi:hypothetical protein VK86_14620 [Moellerella wisconsensis]|nr:hypothetical protein VK86_14620 [Moellerella wisconsensis]